MNLLNFSEEELNFNISVYYTKRYCGCGGVEDDIRAMTDINEIREHLFSGLINRLLSINGIDITDKSTKMVKDLYSNCWGYLQTYIYNSNFQKEIESDNTAEEFIDTFNRYGELVQKETIKLRESSFDEYEEMYRLMYFVLLHIETVKVHRKSFDGIVNLLKSFLKYFNLEIRYDYVIHQLYFYGNDTMTIATYDMISRLIDLMIFDSVYPCNNIHFIKDEVSIKSIEDVLNIMQYDKYIELDED